MVDSVVMSCEYGFVCFFFSSRRRHTRFDCDWSSDVCSSDLNTTTVSTTFIPTLLPSMSTGQRYHIYLAFYYWLPNGPVTAGGSTHQCLDTQEIGRASCRERV